MQRLYPTLLKLLFRALYIEALVIFFKRYKPIFIVLFLGLTFIFLEFLRSVDLEDIMAYKDSILFLDQKWPWISKGSFFLICLFASLLSLPITTALNIIGGFLFGFIEGTLLNLFSIVFGSSLFFLIIRVFLYDFLMRKKVGTRIKRIHKKLEKDGLYYLVALRMFPLTPLFVTNVIMGLSSMKYSMFCILSFISFFPACAIYAQIGAELSQLRNLQDLVSFRVLLPLSLAGLFPLCLSYILNILKKLKKINDDFVWES